MRKLKIIINLILIILLSAIFQSIAIAADNTYTTTSNINGVTVNWSYELNESNEIINLKCINPAEIAGNFEVPSTIDNKKVSSVGEKAFKSGINITGVSIPSSIKTIEREAFLNCTGLTNVDLGNVEALGEGAFSGCTSLESITIPRTLKSGPSIIATYVFKNCSKLTTITLEEGIEVVPTRVCAGTSITNIKIPTSVKTIEAEAFLNCTGLTNVDLGNVEILGAGAFKGCTSLESIIIPKTLKSGPSIIDAYVFKNCSKLTTITLEEGIEVVPTRVCAGTNITSIKMPTSVKTIEAEAFLNCTGLINVDLGNVEILSAGAFEGCTSLESIIIPKTLKSGPSIIDAYVFKDCSKLTAITLEEGIEVVPTRVCAGTNITSIKIPTSVKRIEEDAFLNCAELIKIEIYDNIEDFYGLDSKSEKVFGNHNDDLTIYCYEGSTAAQYAINHDIKYVYLTRPSTGDGTNPDKDNTNTTPEEKPSDSTPKPSTQESSTGKEDTTTATGKLPNTGIGIGVISCVIALLGICTFTYFKYNRLKGI